MTDEFEWDAQKATLNLRKHGVAFQDAQLVFNDVFAMHSFDVDAGYGEQRMKATKHEQLGYYRNETPK
jgi:uncharacterized protein